MIRLLPLLLLLNACASVDGKVNWCLGACVQVEVKKGESPVKPQDFKLPDSKAPE